MTGWGQTGPMSRRAGHDINYIAISGMLHTFARLDERPVPPNNLVGDMGGGGLLLAFGIVSAILHARSTGQGQVVDAAMFEGASLLGTGLYGLMAMGLYDETRPGSHFVDTGSPFYDVYETSDGRYVAVGAIEPQFYAQLLKGLGLDPQELPKQMDVQAWPEVKRRFAETFRTRTRDEWERVFENTDACVSPVLSPLEAARHSHAQARTSFASVEDVVQPTPGPRFSRTPGAIHSAPVPPGADGEAALERWGIDRERFAALRASGAIAG
jgi:alpha-methylacyl-CoA racemase